MLEKQMEKEMRKEITNPKVFINALKKNKYGYSHDSFIMKMLKERK